ncbi:MAG TPA: hypothetical protein VK659_10225 [Asanoa sp.]|nr:hypothetical protein [Asanoa sp.]
MGGTAIRAIKVGAVLIGVYLIGGKATQWGRLLTSAGTAGSGIVKTFQGR